MVKLWIKLICLVMFLISSTNEVKARKSGDFEKEIREKCNILLFLMIGLLL